jgi:hypothetical protein
VTAAGQLGEVRIVGGNNPNGFLAVAESEDQERQVRTVSTSGIVNLEAEEAIAVLAFQNSGSTGTLTDPSDFTAQLQVAYLGQE